jgi:signal peptidase I
LPRRSFVHDYFQAAIIAVMIALFVRTYLVQAFQIPSPSMESTIRVGDHILVNKFAYGRTLTVAEREILPFRPIARHDVIIFKFPGQPERDYVKRVIGLPGETVEIKERQVMVKRVGESQFYTLREDYVRHIDSPSAPDPDSLNNMPPTVVPPGSYFVLGDNREDSRDSREWGPVPEDHIRGKALLVYWSVSPLEDNTPPQGPMASFLESASATFTRTRWERTFHVVR